jgi:undecaprenyl-diphosphatase
MAAEAEALAIVLAAFLAAALLLRSLAWLLWRAFWAVARWAPKRLAGAAEYAHPLRAAAEARAPRFYRFFARRLDPRRFHGLPLTLLAAAAIYLAALFGGLIEELYEKDELAAADARVAAVVAPWRTDATIRLAAWVTNLGDSATLLAVILVATGFLWADRRPLLIAPLWLNFLGAQITTWAGKFGFDRPRPEFLTDVTALSPSFPSGHATGAVAVYGFVAYALARDLKDPRQRFELAYWTSLLALLIAGSRVFLSVHYASDVAAGLLVGGFWLLVGFAVAELLRARAAGQPLL